MAESSMTGMSGHSIETLIYHAQRELAAGHDAGANHLTQQALDIDPQSVPAHVMLSKIATHLGLHDWAARFSNRALSLSGAPVASPDSAATSASPPPARPRDGGVLVIKALRQGFWAEVSHVLGALLLAEITGRKPVTLWDAKCLYTCGTVRDAFLHYFEPLSSVTPDDIPPLAGSDVYPRKWVGASRLEDRLQRLTNEGSWTPSIYLLGRPEFSVISDSHFGVPDLVRWIPEDNELYGLSTEEVFRRLIAKYLRPTRAVKESVAVLDREFKLSEVEIAIHMRGTDKGSEVNNLKDINAFYFTALEKIYRGGHILLLTEDSALIAPFQDRFGDKVLIPAAKRGTAGTAPHLVKGGDRRQLGIEAARDVYAAAKTRAFLGNGASNLSCMISLLMKPPARTSLISKNILFERYPFDLRYKAI